MGRQYFVVTDFRESEEEMREMTKIFYLTHYQGPLWVSMGRFLPKHILGKDLRASSVFGK